MDRHDIGAGRYRSLCYKQVKGDRPAHHSSTGTNQIEQWSSWLVENSRKYEVQEQEAYKVPSLELPSAMVIDLRQR